jgi:hypothetical protein
MDAVVVFGAGMSFAAGMPLAGQLPPLVWHTLDAHPNVKQSVCNELAVPMATVSARGPNGFVAESSEHLCDP